MGPAISPPCNVKARTSNQSTPRRWLRTLVASVCFVATDVPISAPRQPIAAAAHISSTMVSVPNTWHIDQKNPVQNCLVEKFVSASDYHLQSLHSHPLLSLKVWMRLNQDMPWYLKIICIHSVLVSLITVVSCALQTVPHSNYLLLLLRSTS